MKPTIWTTLIQDSDGTPEIENRGVGENHRVSVMSTVHTGIKPALLRKVSLVLTENDAFELALKLLGTMPVDKLANSVRYQRLLRMAEACQLKL